MNFMDSQTATTRHTIQTSPMAAENMNLQTVETPYNNNAFSVPFDSIRTNNEQLMTYDQIPSLTSTFHDFKVKPNRQVPNLLRDSSFSTNYAKQQQMIQSARPYRATMTSLNEKRRSTIDQSTKSMKIVKGLPRFVTMSPQGASAVPATVRNNNRKNSNSSSFFVQRKTRAGSQASKEILLLTQDEMNKRRVNAMLRSRLYKRDRRPI